MLTLVSSNAPGHGGIASVSAEPVRGGMVFGTGQVPGVDRRDPERHPLQHCQRWLRHPVLDGFELTLEQGQGAVRGRGLVVAEQPLIQVNGPARHAPGFPARVSWRGCSLHRRDRAGSEEGCEQDEGSHFDG